MEQLIWYSLLWAFLGINFYIIEKDIKEKIIPNTWLLGIIWIGILWLIYLLFFNELELNILPYLIHIGVAFLVNFFLFHFGIWWAWDAKYTIILSLLIPHIGLLILFWNFVIATFCFLLCNYIFFYISKLFKTSNLKESIIKDISHKLQHLFVKKSRKQLMMTFGIFVMLFIAIRLYRSYIVWFIITNNISPTLILTWVILLIWCVFSFYYLYKKYLQKFSYLYYMGLWIFICIFIWFLSYEYLHHRETLIPLLYKICTSYLIVFIIIKVILYSIKIYMSHDYYCKNISHLQEEDIIERLDFNNKVLPMIEDKKKIYWYYNIPLYGNIVIDHELKHSVRSLIRSLNKMNKKSFEWNSVIEELKCMRTFALAPYIFTAFVITILLEDQVIQYILKFIYWLFI